MWKKLIALFFLLLPAPALAALDVTDIPPPKGMITNYQLINTNGDYSPYAENVFFDKDLGPSKRTGFFKDNLASFGTTPVRGLWRFVDSSRTQDLVSLSSGVLRYSVNASSWIVICSTLSTTDDFDAVSAFSRLTFSSNNSSFYWTGSGGTVPTSTGMVEGRYLEKFQNRIAVAGVDGSRSILYLSALLDPDNFVLGGNSADPVAFTIGANDGDVITGLYAFANSLVIFKTYSTWVLTGTSQTDFSIRSVSQLIGCIQDRSIQEKQGKLVWLSKRGLEQAEFNKLFATSIKEGDITLISEPVKDIVDNIIAGDETETQNSQTDTTQQDFQAGYSTYTSLVDVPGTVRISSPTQGIDPTLTSSITVYATTVPIVMSFVPKLNTQIFSIDLQVAGPTFPCVPGGVNYSAVGIYPNATNPSTSPAIVSAILARCEDGLSANIANTRTVTFSTCALRANTTYWIGVYTDTNTANGWGIFIDSDILSDVFIYSYLPQQLSPAGSYTFQPFEFTHNIRVTSSTFSSSVKDLGSMASRFLTFDSNYTLNGGLINFFVRGSATQAGVWTAAWVPQVVGSTVSLTATSARFTQWKAEFTVTAASHAPSIQDVSIGYVTSDTKQRVVSWIIDDRYYLAHTTRTNSTATNDAMLILDRANNFTRFTNLTALSFADAFDRHYFGTSVSSGFVYYFNDTYSDDGAAIPAVLELKDFCGKDCIRESFFHDFYLRTKNPGSGSGSVAVEYQVDNSGSYTSMGSVSLTEASGLITAKVPVPFGTAGSRGRSIRIRMREATLGQDFRFYGGRVNYQTVTTDE